MWAMLPSLQPCVDALAPVFTAPSCATHARLLLGWLMCLGRRTLRRVALSARPAAAPDNTRRHGLDCYYNFFERSAWSVADLAYRVAVLILSRLHFPGRLTLLVDDTLAHKRGEQVWGLGWWRDAVASTEKRVATASGHNWVVLAVAYTPPGCSGPVLALPLLARLRLPGKGQPGCAGLAKEMLAEVLSWWPGRSFTLVADGAYACKELLAGLDRRVEFVGRLRGDAAVYDARVPRPHKGKRGPRPKKGPRLPSPREAARKADRKRTPTQPWCWTALTVTLYGAERRLKAVAYEAVWPHVLGLRPVRVVVVRDVAKRLGDVYLFTTERAATPAWVAEQFGKRWAIEVLFKGSKQVLEVEGPQHWCRASVEKVAPWVWALQSVVMVWYLSVGRELPQACVERARLGPWDSEWSLRFMLRVLRHATLDATITTNSAAPADLTEMLETLKNWAMLAA